jgi:excisionase family DNA binding protein
MATDTLLLDVRGVAAALSVSRRTVQGLIYTGELASVKIGRCRRVSAAELAAFVQNKTAEGRSSPAVQEASASGHPTPV